MRKIGGFFGWVIYSLILILAISAFFAGRVGTGVLMLIAAIIAVPAQPVRELKGRRRFGRSLSNLFVLALIIAGLLLMPSDAPADNDITLGDALEPQNYNEADVTDDTEEEKSTFSVLFIDVGQGDAALVECDGHYMLIDGGNKADSDLMYTLLKDKGIDRLDIVVGTHADEDHVGGLAGALNYAKADLTLCSVTEYDSKAFANFAKYAGQNGNGITVPSVGDEYALGSARVTVLAVNSGEESNETSIVLKIVYGETSFLFTGDAEKITEETLAASDFDLSSTVLKVSHHGSDSSTGDEFLSLVSPQYAVISVGEGNDYSHPSQTVLGRLESSGAAIYRTDVQGSIYCVSDGVNVRFEVEKNVGADTFAAPAVQPEPQPAETHEPQLTQQEPAEYDYILNMNTGKFHWPDCHSVDEMNEENKWYFTGTRDEITEMGYVSCQNCNP